MGKGLAPQPPGRAARHAPRRHQEAARMDQAPARRRARYQEKAPRRAPRRSSSALIAATFVQAVAPLACVGGADNILPIRAPPPSASLASPSFPWDLARLQTPPDLHHPAS